MILLATTPFWAGLVLSAFASVILFFQVDSAWSDAHKWRGKFIALGVFFALACIFFIVKTAQTSH